HDGHEADQALRRHGLRLYFMHDYQALKLEMRRRNRRVKMLTLLGAVLVGMSAGFAGVMVSYAGRERAPRVADLRTPHPTEGSPIPLAVGTDEERELALDVYSMWEGFVPNATKSIEVSRSIMVIETNAGIRNLASDELDMLVANTVKAHNRRFQPGRSTLFVLEGELTILEVDYTRLTKAVNIKHYS
ncbi:MAG: hypothetical protein U9Q79_10560, partial [Candidatus Hydrogenedentes bacterium]|nr:hypothetical protein [Candidatus Hydrogenedentota bacterium]